MIHPSALRRIKVTLNPQKKKTVTGDKGKRINKYVFKDVHIFSIVLNPTKAIAKRVP